MPFGDPAGDFLSLISWRAPVNQPVSTGQLLTVQLGWHTGRQPIRGGYTFGVYALDAAQHVAAQTDSLLNDGLLLTSSLLPNYTLPDTMTLNAPTTAGTYTLALVVYDTVTHARLQVPGAVNGLYILGTLTVQ